jgi:FkbM family methyltransferase
MKQVIKQLATFGLLGDINAALKYDFRSRLRHLGQKGEIQTVYDIGAHHGNWSRGMKRLLPSASFFLIEANPSCRPYLIKSKFPFALRALSDSKGNKTFHTNNSTGDSFYLENEALSGVSNWQTKELEVVDLDSCAAELGFPFPDWIKMDVQGSELDILAGGRRVFSHARYLLCEIPLVPYNQGAPSFSDYLEAFVGAGFDPLAIVESHFLPQKGKGNVLFQLDIFFGRACKTS